MTKLGPVTSWRFSRQNTSVEAATVLFTKLRINSARNLLSTMEARPRYYASIRGSTLNVDSMKDGIMASFHKLKTLYSEAVFPGVYSLIGVMNSGGTTTDRALLIGTEMYSLTNRTPMKSLPIGIRLCLSALIFCPDRDG